MEELVLEVDDDCLDCGRHMELVLINPDEDTITYYCGSCDQYFFSREIGC